MILITPAFAAPGSSGAMNMNNYSAGSSCPANNGCKTTTPSCPLKKQIKLSGSQDFDDDEFLLLFLMAWPFIIVLMIPVAIARVMQIVITLIYAVITSIIYGGEDKG